ncbi:uncharacterized protein [Pithys albifrons albifrons]|uniref:uncharacterized protein n=1 Tax=Pithys albifrons albifrons TaxID=3385563 RepID=UPI003A5CDC02
MGGGVDQWEGEIGRGEAGQDRRGRCPGQRKRKKELEKGQEVAKVMKKEPECSVQPGAKASAGTKEKKKPWKVKEKPVQENIISSSLKQEAAEGKGLGSSLRNGIQAEEGSAPGSEDTRTTLPQGPSVELKDSSGSQDKPHKAGPAVRQQLLESQNGIGVPKPRDGGIASPSGDPGASEMDVGLTAVREGEEEEEDPPVPQQEGDGQALQRRKPREKKQGEKKQRKRSGK